MPMVSKSYPTGGSPRRAFDSVLYPEPEPRTLQPVLVQIKKYRAKDQHRCRVYGSQGKSAPGADYVLLWDTLDRPYQADELRVMPRGQPLATIRSEHRAIVEARVEHFVTKERKLGDGYNWDTRGARLMAESLKS